MTGKDGDEMEIWMQRRTPPLLLADERLGAATVAAPALAWEVREAHKISIRPFSA